MVLIVQTEYLDDCFVVDTWLISKKMGPDEYILAAVNLYLDFSEYRLLRGRS